MVKICPVSKRNINENVSRLNAFFTFSFVVGYFLTGSVWFLPVIIIDFVLRLAMEGRISPIVKINSIFLDLINLPKIMINAGPKIFAARIGLTLAIVGLLFLIMGFHQASFIVTGILGFFSFLEFSLGICVACKLYPYALAINDLKVFR